jgi:hypothetical protein
MLFGYRKRWGNIKIKAQETRYKAQERHKGQGTRLLDFESEQAIGNWQKS